MQIITFTFNPFQENTYLLSDDSNECVLIDAGCYTPEEQKELVDYVAQNDLTVTKILSTHGHIDHVLGNKFCCEHFGAPLYVYEKDVQQHESVKSYCMLYGFSDYQEKLPDVILPHDQTSINFGNTELEIIFAPGHAPGHIVFLHRDTRTLIGGDVLFQRSIGRTDLPGGDFDTLIQSIHEKIFPLGDDIVIYPGHGPTTTIGEEKVYNPFCAIAQ